MKMSNFVSYKSNFIIIDINDPIFVGDKISRVAINKDYIDKARHYSKYLVIRTPTGEQTFLPKNMKKMKTFKKVFLYKDNPMTMVELDIPHCDKRPNEFYEATTL